MCRDEPSTNDNYKCIPQISKDTPTKISFNYKFAEMGSKRLRLGLGTDEKQREWQEKKEGAEV